MKRPVRVEHVAVWVQDLDQMRDFYVTVLSGQSGPRYHNPDTGFTSHFISFGEGCRIELMHRPNLLPHSRAEEPSAGFAHVALSLGGRLAVDTAVEALRRQGVTIESEPRTTGDGYYEAVIRDPEGNRIELTA
jgi:lactoylglutathione lyase